jgi:hypothetical protein
MNCAYLARVVTPLVMALIVVACDSSSRNVMTDTGNAIVSIEAEPANNGKLLIASGVVFQAQKGEEIWHRVSAKTISVAPRKFGAFNINGFNELLIEDSEIEVFPTSQGEGDGSDSGGSDFTKTLQDYAESLESIYGVVSRIHMQNVRIILHEASRDGGDVNVRVEQLIKEFGEDQEPELHRLEFYDDQSPNVLKVDYAKWQATAEQFVVKNY